MHRKLISLFRQVIRKNVFLRKLIANHVASTGLFDKYFESYSLTSIWQNRLKDILFSPDNAFIDRVNNAGKISHGKQIMHNGLKIYVGSYYGPEYSVVLRENRGVHEPQEERVFSEALKTVPANGTMLEMGAFWSFYSMWFKSKTLGQNFMVEPDSFNLSQGKRNFKLNKMKGTFIQAFIGKGSIKNVRVPTLCVDDILSENGINFLDILHSDIQGYEYEMLQGAIKTIEAKKIGYIFISTHSNEVHYKCLDFLKIYCFVIIASADVTQSFSEDGLIVGRASYYPGIEPIDISLKGK